MIDWLDDFYGSPALRQTMMDAFLPAFTTYVAEAVGGPVAAGFVSQLASAYVQHHLDSSRIQLQEVLKDADEPLKALADRFTEWEAKRPEKVARNELVRAANAANVQQMRERGVTRKVWRTRGDSCPYCKSLNGKTIEVERAFFEPGEEFTPEGADKPLTFTSSIGHPPVHQGCNCVVEASVETEQVAGEAPYASVDDMPADVREAYDLARGYDSIEGDRQLRVLTNAQGFTGKPMVLTDAELDAYIANGETEFWRGMTKDSYADRWLYGDDVRHGTGYYGNGTYTAVGRGIEPPDWRKRQGYVTFEAREVAETFAFNDGVVMRGSLRSDARVLTLSTEGTDLNYLDIEDVFPDLTDAERAMDSITHVAASRGYDAVMVEGLERIGGELGGDQLIILNRGAVRMSSTITPTRPAAVVREEAKARQ